MKDSSIINVLLHMRLEAIRGDQSGLGHINALLLQKGYNPADQPIPQHRPRMFKRGQLKRAILAALRDGPKSGPESIYTKYQEYTSTHYHDRAEYRTQRECFNMEGIDLSKCESEIEKAYRDSHRAQYDLEAQRNMAFSALVMAVAAIGAFGATIYGLFIIKGTLVSTNKTLEATRKMAASQQIIGEAQTKAAFKAIEVTREIGKAQVRAYLDMTEIIPIFLPPNSGFAAQVSIQNTGASPARNITIEINVIVKSGNKIIYNTVDTKAVNVPEIPAGNNCTTVPIGDGNTSVYDAIITNGVIDSIALYKIKLSWHDVFTDPDTQTKVFAGLLYDDNGIVGFSINDVTGYAT